MYTVYSILNIMVRTLQKVGARNYAIFDLRGIELQKWRKCCVRLEVVIHDLRRAKQNKKHPTPRKSYSGARGSLLNYVCL